MVPQCVRGIHFRPLHLKLSLFPGSWARNPKLCSSWDLSFSSAQPGLVSSGLAWLVPNTKSLLVCSAPAKLAWPQEGTGRRL